jgi:hypothetical protein
MDDGQGKAISTFPDEIKLKIENPLIKSGLRVNFEAGVERLESIRGRQSWDAKRDRYARRAAPAPVAPGWR